MKDDHSYLQMAFEQAELARDEGTFPIGAVIVNEEGEVVGRGRNKIFSDCDVTSHAEVEALRSASSLMVDPELKKFTRRQYTLYTTCEPCPMCCGSILLSMSIVRVVWAANDESMGMMRKLKQKPLFFEKYSRIEITEEPYEELKNRQISLMSDFFSMRGIEGTEWQIKEKNIKSR